MEWVMTELYKVLVAVSVSSGGRVKVAVEEGCMDDVGYESGVPEVSCFGIVAVLGKLEGRWMASSQNAGQAKKDENICYLTCSLYY